VSVQVSELGSAAGAMVTDLWKGQPFGAKGAPATGRAKWPVRNRANYFAFIT
jgi:hypothetical protein